MSILHTNKNKKPPKKTPERIEKIFQSFLKQNPNPTTELNYSNHFELLIAVMLSAHTTVIFLNVNIALFLVSGI